ncbi:MAG: hypothetical protein ACOYMG_21445 [Candidatus Methylumidiphilus sp.]
MAASRTFAVLGSITLPSTSSGAVPTSPASSPAAFSDALKRAAAQHHGQAGRAFLEKLTFDSSDLCAMLEEVKVAPMFATDGTEGQDKRAAARFALIGMAGELATEYGVTGWPVGAAGEAAAHEFKIWLSMRGKGNDERRQILQRVSGFIERHGDGRFSDADTTNDVQIRDRAGWWRDGHDGKSVTIPIGTYGMLLLGDKLESVADGPPTKGNGHTAGHDAPAKTLTKYATDFILLPTGMQAQTPNSTSCFWCCRCSSWHCSEGCCDDYTRRAYDRHHQRSECCHWYAAQ